MKLHLVIVAVLLMACNNERQQNKKFPKKDTASKQTPQLQGDSAAVFGIELPQATIFLQQWDSTINLQEHLGKPLAAQTRKLDQNSDTHAGSYIRNMEFEGIKLSLFSPHQNGRTFWIQQIILTSSRYKTINGVRIGDSLESVKKNYPGLQKFPGENENMYNVADAGYEKSIEMEFAGNRLKKLRMYYMIP